MLFSLPLERLAVFNTGVMKACKVVRQMLHLFSIYTHTHSHFCTVYQLPLMSLIALPWISSLSRTCVSECPSGFFRDDKKRCKKCSSACETCVGSRSDQCTSCRAGYHLSEGTNMCVSSCSESYYLDHGMFDFNVWDMGITSRPDVTFLVWRKRWGCCGCWA